MDWGCVIDETGIARSVAERFSKICRLRFGATEGCTSMSRDSQVATPVALRRRSIVWGFN